MIIRFAPGLSQMERLEKRINGQALGLAQPLCAQNQEPKGLIEADFMKDPHITAAQSSSSVASGDEPQGIGWPRSGTSCATLFIRAPTPKSLREVVEELIEEPTSESGISAAERDVARQHHEIARTQSQGDCRVPRADIIAADVGTLDQRIDGS